MSGDGWGKGSRFGLRGYGQNRVGFPHASSNKTLVKIRATFYIAAN